MVMALEAIAIQSADWATLTHAERETYENSARRLGIALEIREGDTRSWVLDYFNGTISLPCRRPPWEHRLRQLLELDDPCFSAASH